MTNGEKSWDRILVIDDEQGLREGCRRVLSRYHFQVDLAAMGYEGLALFRQNHPDLVLLDVMMPDISGIELMNTLRGDDPDIVCIIITGYATVELAVEAMKLGAYDFIAKPFSDDNLLLAVEKGLEKRRLEQESRRMQQAEEEARRLSQEKAMLEELDRVKTAFMRKVAHELRAPIGAIQSFLTSILAGYGSPQVQHEMMERAVLRAGELLDLVNDLLNLSRLKDAKMELKRQDVSLNKILDEVISLHAADAQQKRIKLDVTCEETPAIQADPAHIKQLWTNLVSNAIKYTPEGGRVRVHLRAEEGVIVGDVEDTGIGIAPEDMPRLFEEFYRTEKAKAFAQYGTGLGLSIVRQIVTECGGEIGVESQVNKGTRFTFRLPTATA